MTVTDTNHSEKHSLLQSRVTTNTTVLGMEFRTFHIPLISGPLLKHIYGLRVSGDGQHYDNAKTHLQNENQCENV